MIAELTRCDSLKTRTGKPCGILILPCRHHDETRARETKTGSLSPRQQILAARIAKGDSIKEAAQKAGYRGSSVTSKVYSLAHSAKIKAQIRAHIRAAYSLHTDEIVGRLVSDMRADIYDLLPDNKIVKSAHERGSRT
jgi:DNA-binding CsgD family transcriptional regulator